MHKVTVLYVNPVHKTVNNNKQTATLLGISILHVIHGITNKRTCSNLKKEKEKQTEVKCITKIITTLHLNSSFTKRINMFYLIGSW